jgi:hypothetical protein
MNRSEDEDEYAALLGYDRKKLKQLEKPFVSGPLHTPQIPHILRHHEARFRSSQQHGSPLYF